MKDEWYCQPINDIIKCGLWSRKQNHISIPIHREINPGKFEMLFCVDGEFISQEEMSIMTQSSPTSITICN